MWCTIHCIRCCVCTVTHTAKPVEMWMAATLVSMYTRSRNLHAALAVKAEVVEVHGLVPNRCAGNTVF